MQYNQQSNKKPRQKYNNTYNNINNTTTTTTTTNTSAATMTTTTPIKPRKLTNQPNSNDQPQQGPRTKNQDKPQIARDQQHQRSKQQVKVDLFAPKKIYFAPVSFLSKTPFPPPSFFCKYLTYSSSNIHTSLVLIFKKSYKIFFCYCDSQ